MFVTQNLLVAKQANDVWSNMYTLESPHNVFLLSPVCWLKMLILI